MQTTQFVYSKIPFVRIIVPFILGIFLFRYFPDIPFWLAFTLTLVGFVVLFLWQTRTSLRNNYKMAPYWGLILTLTFFFIGYSLSSIKSRKTEIIQKYENGFLMGDIIEQPSDKEKSVKTIVDIKAFRSDNQWIPAEDRIVLYFQKDKRTESLKTGDRIIFEPFIKEVKNAGNPEEFDYKQYLAYHLISQQGYLKSEKWKLLQSKAETGFFAFAEDVREKLISILKKNGLHNEVLGVASAISIGYKNELDDEIKKSYAATGATHILSVSGLHVGIVYAVLHFMFSFFSRKKYLNIIKTILILILLWGYAVLTGLCPSVLRATTMFSFVVIGRAFDRQTNIYNSLSASAFVLLAFNPFILFDVGFQLSYLAVIGIVFFQPYIYKLFYIKNKVIDKLWLLTSVSIAAQITTFPLCLYYFHQFPVYFILSGLVVVPLSSVIIYAVILLFIISPWEWGASMVGKGLYYVIDFMNNSIHFIENIPGALITEIQFSRIELILFYLLLITLTLFIINKKLLYFKLVLFCILGILIAGLISEFSTLKQRKLFVYNINGISAINFIDGSKNVLFSDISYRNNFKTLKGNWLSLGVESEKIVPFSQLKDQFLFTNLLTVDNENLFFKKNFINFYGCRIFTLNSRYKSNHDHVKNFSLDYLVLSNNVSMDLKEIILDFNPRKIIIDSSNSKWKTEAWIKEAKDLKIEYFSVAQSGAFVADL